MKTCIDCDQPAVSGRARCQAHLERSALTSKRFAAKRKQSGLCVDCGNALLSCETRRYCNVCREKRNQKSRERYAQRRADGLCLKCGRATKNDLKHCDKCLAIIREAARQHELKTPRHKTKERDKFKCRLCSSNSNLVVHHIDCIGERTRRDYNGYRRRQNTNESLDNLITLCKTCHYTLTRLINVNTELAIELLQRSR